MLPPSEFEKKDFKGDYPTRQGNMNLTSSSIEGIRASILRAHDEQEQRSDICTECESEVCEYIAEETDTDVCCYCADLSPSEWCEHCQEEYPDTYADLLRGSE